jgi:hypothetical protein
VSIHGAPAQKEAGVSIRAAAGRPQKKSEKRKKIEKFSSTRSIRTKFAMLPAPPVRWMAIKVDVKVQKEWVTRINVGPLECNTYDWEIHKVAL